MDDEVDWEYNSWWLFPTELLLLLFVADTTPPPPPPPYKADSNWIDARIVKSFADKEFLKDFLNLKIFLKNILLFKIF